MDLSRSRVVLRQRSLLDILDLALRFVVAHAGAFARVAAVAVVPAALVSWGLAERVDWGWAWTLTIVLGLLVETPFTLLASRLVFDPDARPAEVLRASLRALPRVFVLRVVQIGVVAVGLLVFVLPGVWLGVILLFVTEALLLEGATLGGAMSRSQRLAGSQSGQALVAAIALTALHLGATFLGDDVGRALVSDLFQFREPEPLWRAGGSPLALLGFWLFLPYAATARFFVYLDLRTRSEGWDIQTGFAAIALRARDSERKAA
jgi:hypothetical protein